MEKEDAVNILQFWLAADNFQCQLAAKKGQYDGQEAQNDAMILYDKWVLLQIYSAFTKYFPSIWYVLQKYKWMNSVSAVKGLTGSCIELLCIWCVCL